jgi:hypothetical protein
MWGPKKNSWTILLGITDFCVEIWTNDLPNAKRESGNFAVIDTTFLNNTVSNAHNKLWMKNNQKGKNRDHYKAFSLNMRNDQNSVRNRAETRTKHSGYHIRNTSNSADHLIQKWNEFIEQIKFSTTWLTNMRSSVKWRVSVIQFNKYNILVPQNITWQLY